MKFIDLFSGIGGIRLGLEMAGHKCAGFCEFDKFARTAYKAIYETEGEWEAYDIRTVKPYDIPTVPLMNEVLNAYAKADFRFAHALNVFQGLIDKAPTVEERKQGHWIDLEFDDVSICSLCKNPQEVETLYCPECGAIMDGVEK